MSKDTGGPAFPQQDTSYGTHFEGLSLRDYFASKAMQTFCASNEGFAGNEQIASVAYQIADAMLQERNK